MDLSPSPRGTRKDQAQTEWNSSGSYARNPILLSMRYKKARPAWVGTFLAAVVAGAVGLSAGLLLPSPAPPAPAPAPPAAVAPAPVAAAPVAVDPAPAPAVKPKRSRQADKALELGWDAYGHGRYDRSKELALDALVAVGAEHGTPAQEAQAKGLLEQSLLSLQQPDLVPLIVKAPEPEAAPQPVPALIQEPVVRQEPVVQAAPRVAPQPAALPNHSYPRAQARSSSWRMPTPVRLVNLPAPMALPPVVRFNNNTSGLPPGMDYPAGRGPNQCPNYQTVDDCECHQYEWRAMRMNNARPSNRPSSRMEAWRRSESRLGQSTVF